MICVMFRHTAVVDYHNGVLLGRARRRIGGRRMDRSVCNNGAEHRDHQENDQYYIEEPALKKPIYVHSQHMRHLPSPCVI